MDTRPRLAWNVDVDNDTAVVHVTGEVDISTRESFDEAARAGLDSPSNVVILDLAGVTFLGSVGLQILVRANSAAEAAGRVLRVVDGSAIVRRIMAITGLEQLLALYPSVEDARSA